MLPIYLIYNSLFLLNLSGCNLYSGAVYLPEIMVVKIMHACLILMLLDFHQACGMDIQYCMFSLNKPANCSIDVKDKTVTTQLIFKQLNG